MRSTPRRKAVTGLATATALALAACGGGGDDDVDAEELTEGDEFTEGAMEDFSVGDTFVATTEEPLELSFMYRDHPNYPLDEDWLIFSHLEEEHNVTFDLHSVPLSDWEQGRSIAIGAGNAPDVIPITYPGDESQFVASGAILPISDYLDLMPHLQQRIEEWGLQPEIDQQRQLDGRFYMIPGVYENPNPQYSFVIRQDLFEASGFTEDPETFEEFADQMEQVMADHGLDYAYSERWNGGGPMEATTNFIAPPFGTEGGWGYANGLTWDEDAGEFVYTGAMDGYRDMLAYLHDLVDRGVLDPESVSQDDDTAEAKFSSGQSAVIGGNTQEILGYRDFFDDEEVELRLIDVPAGPAGDIMGVPRTESGIMFSAQLAEKDTLVATLQFVDWLYYSDEGLEFAKWGVEGETFHREGEERVLAENIDINGLNPGAPEQLNVDYGFHNGVWMLAHGSTQDLVESMLRDEVIEFVDEMIAKEWTPVAPPIPYDEMQQEQQALTSQQLQDQVMQNTAQFILGQRDLAEWDEYVQELEGLGMSTYVETANEAHAGGFDEDAFED